MTALETIVAEFGVSVLVLAGIAAIVTSSIHGSVGVAGGFLMTAALALLIGVRPVIPVMSIALIVSHGSRSLLNVRDFNATAFFAIMITALPMIALGSFLYGALPVQAIAAVLGTVILLSIPLRHWARARQIEAGPRTLNGVGVVYGTLAGASIGSVMILTPFLLGYGLAKEAFVATMAVISLTTNLSRIVVFGTTELLDTAYVVLGLYVGILMIPGNWIGRRFLRSMAPSTHSRLVDAFAIVGALNFYYLAAYG